MGESENFIRTSYINRYKGKMKEIMRYPRLDSILMVEAAAKKYSGNCGRYQLWNKLPRKMMYQTFTVILDYLEKSGKILLDNEGKVVWIWNPRMIKRLQDENLVV